MTTSDHHPPSSFLTTLQSLKAAWGALLHRAARSATFRIVMFSLAVRVFTAFLAFLAWRAAGKDPVAMRRALVAVVLVPLGLVLCSAYVDMLSGSYLEWTYSIQRWNDSIAGSPIKALMDLAVALLTRPYEYLTTDPEAPYDVLNGVTGFIPILSLPFVGRRFGAAFVVHMVLNLWLPLSSGVFKGVGRYCGVLFPFYFVIATTRPFILGKGLLVISAALYMLCLALCTNLHPIF